MMWLNLKAETTGESILKMNDSLGTASYFTFISLLLETLRRWKEIR